MIKREDLITNNELCLDKAIGALIGLAIGDSFGDAARKPDNQRDYGFTTDFNKGASWSTDDTEFALLCAKLLIDTNGEFTTDDVEKLWLTHVVTEDELRRGGASEVEACTNLKRGLKAPETGMFNAYYMSDGAAMRSAPIGIMCAGDPERAKILAEREASISHYREGIWGAQAVAVAVSLAMVDATMEEILEAVMETAPENSWFRVNLEKAFKIIDDANGDLLDSWMPLHNQLFSQHRSTVAEAIPETFGCLKLEHSSFKKGLILASNFGRDADTIGAVAGAVLGAKFGLKNIPVHWAEKTRYPTGTCLKFTNGLDIFQYATELAKLIK